MKHQEGKPRIKEVHANADTIRAALEHGMGMGPRAEEEETPDAPYQGIGMDAAEPIKADKRRPGQRVMEMAETAIASGSRPRLEEALRETLAAQQKAEDEEASWGLKGRLATERARLEAALREVPAAATEHGPSLREQAKTEHTASSARADELSAALKAHGFEPRVAEDSETSYSGRAKAPKAARKGFWSSLGGFMSSLFRRNPDKALLKQALKEGAKEAKKDAEIAARVTKAAAEAALHELDAATKETAFGKAGRKLAAADKAKAHAEEELKRIAAREELGDVAAIALGEKKLPAAERSAEELRAEQYVRRGNVEFYRALDETDGDALKAVRLMDERAAAAKAETKAKRAARVTAAEEAVSGFRTGLKNLRAKTTGRLPTLDQSLGFVEHHLVGEGGAMQKAVEFASPILPDKKADWLLNAPSKGLEKGFELKEKAGKVLSDVASAVGREAYDAVRDESAALKRKAKPHVDRIKKAIARKPKEVWHDVDLSGLTDDAPDEITQTVAEVREDRHNAAIAESYSSEVLRLDLLKQRDPARFAAEINSIEALARGEREEMRETMYPSWETADFARLIKQVGKTGKSKRSAA